MSSRITYPWGQRGPRAELSQTSGRLRLALAAAAEPGYAGIDRRLEAAVQAAQPLTAVLRYVADAGLQSRSGKGGGDQRVSGADLYDALRALDEAVVRLAQASVASVSEDYGAFVEAANAVLELAEQAVKGGVLKQPADDAQAAWRRFGA